MATYTNWSGGTSLRRWETVDDKFDFCCTLLDKGNLVETRYTRAELESFLKEHPTRSIVGIRHENGVLKQVYAYRNAVCIIVDKYALVTECVMDGGKFAQCRLYKKGAGLIHKFDTPHSTHFEWSFKLYVSGDAIKITAVFGKSDENYIYMFNSNGNVLTVLKEPTQREVDSRKVDSRKVEVHSCSSCDARVPVDECDNCGRCARCQELYGKLY